MMTPRAKLLSALAQADGPVTLSWLARIADVGGKDAEAILYVLRGEGRVIHHEGLWHA